MKTAKMAAKVFAFLTLVGGYFAHQYFWAAGPEAALRWTEQILPMVIALGWILLVAAVALSFTPAEDDS